MPTEASTNRAPGVHKDSQDAQDSVVVELVQDFAGFQKGDFLEIVPVSNPVNESLVLAYDEQGHAGIIRWDWQLTGVFCVEGQIIKLVRFFPDSKGAALTFEPGWVEKTDRFLAESPDSNEPEENYQQAV